MNPDPSRAFTGAGRSAALLLGCLLVFGSSPVHAQRTSTGQTGTGQIGTGQTGGMGTGVGGQGVGGQGVGGQGVGGNSGGLEGPTFRQFGTDVDTTDGTGFAGRTNVAENFVGGMVQQDQATGAGRFGQNNPFSAINRQGQFNRNNQPTGPSRSERLRPRHRIAFTHEPRQAESISTLLQTRLGALPSPLAGVDVTLDADGVATIRGTASTPHDANLAAALARLEPGVRRVDNQMTVSGGN